MRESRSWLRPHDDMCFFSLLYYEKSVFLCLESLGFYFRRTFEIDTSAWHGMGCTALGWNIFGDAMRFYTQSCFVC